MIRPILRRVLLLCLVFPAAAHALELRVLTAGAYRPVLDAAAVAFEQATGLHLVIQNETAGVVQRRVRAGETVDLIVLPTAGIEALGPMIAPGSMVKLARVGIGVAVRAGAPQPDISSVDAVRAAVLAARAPAWIDPASGGSSGIYMAGLFERWGIAPQLARKAVLVQGGLVGEAVASGRADLGFQQISELAIVRGVDVVGPLPEAMQLYTVYAGAVPAQSAFPAAARQLLAYLSGPEGAEALKSHLMVAP